MPSHYLNQCAARRYGFRVVKLTQHEMNAASAKDIFIAADTDGEPPEDLPNCSNIVTNVCRLHQDFVMWRTNLHQEKYTNSISDTTQTLCVFRGPFC